MTSRNVPPWLTSRNVPPWPYGTMPSINTATCKWTVVIFIFSEPRALCSRPPCRPRAIFSEPRALCSHSPSPVLSALTLRASALYSPSLRALYSHPPSLRSLYSRPPSLRAIYSPPPPPPPDVLMATERRAAIESSGKLIAEIHLPEEV